MANLSRAYCPVCTKYGPAQWDSPSHVLHFALSLFTVGLWLPIWIFVALSGKRHCQACGNNAYNSPLHAWLDTGIGKLFTLLVLFAIGGAIIYFATNR